MTIENINYKKYIPLLNVLGYLEATYNLISSHEKFKEDRDEGIYQLPGGEAIKRIEAIADSAVQELHKTAVLQCGICLENLLNLSLESVLDGLNDHWKDELKKYYRNQITGSGKWENFINLFKLIDKYSRSCNSHGFKDMPFIIGELDIKESDELSKSDKRSANSIYSDSCKYVDVGDFNVLAATTNAKDRVFKTLHNDIIEKRNDISHGKTHGVTREYALESIEFTIRFSVGFLEGLEDYNII